MSPACSLLRAALGVLLSGLVEDSAECKLLCQRMYAAAFDHFWWVLLSNRLSSNCAVFMFCFLHPPPFPSPLSLHPPLLSSFDPVWPSQCEAELREDISHLIGFFNDLKRLPDGNGREGMTGASSTSSSFVAVTCILCTGQLCMRSFHSV